MDQVNPGKENKAIRSQLDEIEAVLSNVPTPLQGQPVPSVAEFIAASNITPKSDDAVSSQTANSCNSLNHSKPVCSLDWSQLPRAVDADSTAMGVSTKKLTAKRQAKRQPVDPLKVQARVARKRAQVESFLLVLKPLLAAAGHKVTLAVQQDEPQQDPAQQHNHHQHHQQQQLSPALHIVDFGCGTGNLLLPLAAAFPSCRFTGVDMKPAALKLLQQRAAAAGLANVYVFQGMIEHFNQPHDVALALHACGNATDHVLQMAVSQGAAFIASPCCVGKLRFSLTGGSSFHSSAVAWTPTQPGDRPVQQQQQQHQDQQDKQQQQHQETHLGQGPQQAPLEQKQLQQADQQADKPSEQQLQQLDASHGAGPRLRHPRSDWLMSQLPDPERHFRIMAKVADLAHAPADCAELADQLKQRVSVAQCCKRFVELDRCAAAAEAGYAVGLFKVLLADTMAKNDMLVGLPLPDTANMMKPGAAAADAGSDPATLDAGEGCAAQVSQQPEVAGSPAGCSAAVRRCLCSCGTTLMKQGLLFTATGLNGPRD